MECRYAISRFCRRGHRSSSALRLSQCACVSRRGTQRERKASQCRFRQRSRTVSPEQPDMWFLVAHRYFTIIVWQWSMFSHKVHVHTSVFHPCVLRLETTKTTGKNKFERGARANSPAHLSIYGCKNLDIIASFLIGLWARASRCACREAIRLGEREARTAKQPQGPAPARIRQVVFKQLFQLMEGRLTFVANNFSAGTTTYFTSKK